MVPALRSSLRQELRVAELETQGLSLSQLLARRGCEQGLVRSKHQ